MRFCALEPTEKSMCEKDDLDEMYEISRARELSRRQFGALSLGVGLTAMLPRLADAADTTEAEVEIKTPDGTCDAYLVHPVKGKYPAVLIWPDIFGLRPAFRQMGKRLAESGYTVLVINPFYRTKKAPTAPEHPDFNDPATRQGLMSLAGTLSPATALTDATAFVAYLDSQPAVDKKRKMGTTGYCMGGPFVFRTAAAFPARVGAGATFHGGGLATDKPESPHLLIPQMKAQFLIAIAENDDQREPEVKNILRDSFAKAHLTAEIEVYTGTKHGWCPPDSAVYNAEQAEKAWGRMMVLFKTALA
jgi:carboxymethylenebutenolidase